MINSTLSSPISANGLITVDWRNNENWLKIATDALRNLGCVVVLDVLDTQLIEATRDALRAAQAGIRSEIGDDRLARAGELGVLRAPMHYDPRMFDLMELEPLLDIVDATVSPTAILHLQNGFVLPSLPAGDAPANFQQSFHMDFPRFMNGYVASINTLLAVDDFTTDNGATLVVPGSHQQPDRPEDLYMQRHAVPVVCPAGSMIVFDSTLWHAAGKNYSGRDRLGVNQQFTRSFIKQQIDYVRALGDEKVEAQAPRTQQLLGWYTRVVTSLDEYYQPAEHRRYRSGQG